MACGRKPFPEGANWKERLEAAPPQPDVGEPLRSALARCLHPDPRARFQNATEIEEALWGRRSRRWLLGAAMGLAVSSGIGVFVKQRFWPTSTVRLAVLQPVISNEGAASAPAIKGFVLALSSRLKTIRGRRPLSLISPSETLAEGVKDPAGSKAVFAATHTLSTEFRQNSSYWSISAALVETSTGKRLKSWNGSSARDDLALAAHMVALQSSIFEQTMQELMLRAEPKRQSLPPEVYADYIEGLYYVRDGEAKKARPYFERVIRAAPESALGYAGLAEALLEDRYKSGDKTLEGKAVEAISKAEQLDPELAHVQLIAGRLFNASGQWEKAAAYFQRAAELGPDDAHAFIQMGVAYFMLNDPHKSAAALQQAIKVQPHFYVPYDYAGWFEYEERNFAAAERHWLASVRLAPGKVRARVNLATLYFTKGRLEEAEKQIRESLNILPTAQSALAARADLYDRTGRHAEAIGSYEEAMKSETKTYKIWAGLGGAYRRAGRETDAIGAFRKGLEYSLEGVSTHQREAERVAWCAYYHAALGENDQARTRAEQALSMNTPPQATLRKLLVLAYGQIRDIEAARRLLDGAPPDLLEELARSPDLAAALARDTRLERFTH
jgi:tetratricopeptide (TPR) repeat protein